MQVNVQKLSPVLLEFAVEIPADRVQGEIERAYVELSRAARIRGYRPGKVPRDVLRHVFGGRISDDVAQRLVNETLPKALEEKSVQPLVTVSISPNKLTPAEPFSYKARFEVAPDLETVKYDGFTVKRPSLTVSDALVNEELESLRKEHAELRAPEPPRPARTGDTVEIDFVLEVAGKAVPDANGESVQAELGGGTLLPEIEAALQGASAGDHKHAVVNFNADHPRPKFRGKEGVFHITLKEVKERVLPELDDEFAKDLGTVETLADLRADVTKQVEKRLQEQVEESVAQQLVTALCEANPIAIPPSLVRKQSELTEREIRQQMRRSGQRGDLPADVRDRLLTDSEKRVQAGLLMAAIAKAEQVTVTNEDVEKAYEELAEQTGKNVARLKAEYRDQEKQQILQGMILEDKILKMIQAKAVVTDEPPAM